MDLQTRNKIKKLSSDIEKLLFKEIETRLLRLGITRKKFLEDSEIKHLDQEERSKREKIGAFINRLRYISPNHLVIFSQFLRESVFVWINRLIGIKCMESRGLILDKNDEITEIITTRPEYGNHSKWLRDFRIENPERTRDKDGGLIAGLKKALVKLNFELGFVFDPNYEPGLVFPRYNVLIEVIKLINNSLEYETYKQDDFLGWIYQYFDEEGKQSIYSRLNESARNKLEDYDIIPYSQLYTDHYIVEFITQNALGTWWRSQYPESKAIEHWDYLLSQSEENNDFDKLKLKDIKILDPACGSGHFLLYAFDLLFELYLEEGIIPKDEIPRYILENNLYGIDIDRRAVQLASLSLYLKAKEINKTLTISKLNLYSTDIIFQNRELFEDLKKRIKEQSEEEKELVESIWQGMRKISALGSLLPIEREIEHFIRSRRNGITQFIDGYDTKWEQWKDNLLNAFNKIINDALENQNSNKLLFARDGMRGVNFLNVFRNRYNIILMNPPYINSRRMNNHYKEALKNYYKSNYFDTSACFIQRSIELLNADGLLGAIFPSTLAFLKNFETIRNQILNHTHIISFVSLGSNAFSEISGERIKVSILISKKGNLGLTKYINTSISRDPPNNLLAFIKNNQVRELNPNIFKNINLKPFLFSLPKEIFGLFEKYPPLIKMATPKKGLDTGDNDRFIRLIWEVEPDKIGSKWLPINKGGGKVRWFGLQKSLIKWENNGKELKNFPRSNIRNEKFYFKEGITYSAVGYYFCARYLPPGYIFETGGSCIFSKESIYFLLSYLNSSLGEFILKQLNPSINRNVGDLYRLPVLIPDGKSIEELSNISKKCIELQKWAYQFILTDEEFIHTSIYYILKKRAFDSLSNCIYWVYVETERYIIKRLIYEALIDKKIFKLNKISPEIQVLITNQSEPRVGKYPIIEGINIDKTQFKQEELQYINNLAQITINQKELNKIPESIKSRKSLEKTSQEFKINPLSVSAIRKLNNIIPDNFAQESIADFLTELIFIVLNSIIDGIISLSENTGIKSLESKILDEIEILVGEDQVEIFKRDLQVILGKSLAQWLNRDFFNRHIVQFERRPPIWHISSPTHNFGCYLHYLRLTKDTASKIRYNYLRPEAEYHKRLIREFQDAPIAQGIELDANDRKKIENLENIMDDLKKFDETLEKLISMNYNPNIDDGIKVNLRPWQDLQLLAVNKVITYKKV